MESTAKHTREDATENATENIIKSATTQKKQSVEGQTQYAPYIKHFDTTQKIRLLFLASMLPTMIYGIYNFGIKAFVVIITSILTCVIVEFFYHLILKQPQTWWDFSAIATGLILAMILPPTLSWWKVVLGAAIGMLVFRMFLGGLGHGSIHTVIAAKGILLLLFYKDMNTFVYLGNKTKTPLEILHAGGVVNTRNMLFGNVAGNIGEVSVLCVLLGALFLIFMGVIDLSVAGPAILAFGVFMAFFGGNRFDWSYIVAQLCGGGFMFGIFYIATDGMTSPITRKGRALYGILIGILIGIFRIAGLETVSVVLAILLANLCAPILERYTIPRYFGQ